MEGLLEPVIQETYFGRAEVRNTFRVKGAGTVAGCYVVDGVLKRDAQVRVVRDGTIIYTSKLSSLKRFKDDASEVRTGYECGAGIGGKGSGPHAGAGAGESRRGNDLKVCDEPDKSPS